MLTMTKTHTKIKTKTKRKLPRRRKYFCILAYMCTGCSIISIQTNRRTRLTLAKTKTRARTKKDRDKDKVLKRPNMCYILEKCEVQGF